MRIHVQSIFTAVLWAMALSSPAWGDDADDPAIRKSVVKIFASIRQPDPFRPWTKGSLHDVTGSGVVIADMVVFKRKEALDSTEEILSDNGIREQCSADIASIWKQRK